MQEYKFTVHTFLQNVYWYIPVFVALSIYCFAVLYEFLCEAICSSSVCLVGFVVVVYSVDAGEGSLREDNELTLLDQLWRWEAAKFPKLLLKTKC